MEPDNPPIKPAGVWHQPAGPATTGQLPLAPEVQHDEPARHRRNLRWVIAVVVVLTAAGAAVAITDPFASAGAGNPGAPGNASGTGVYTVIRRDLSSQIPVPGTLGYAGSVSIGLPSGSSASQVQQAQQAVTLDQQTLSADEQTESDTSTADNQAITRDQATVSTDQATLTSDQATEKQACAGASSTACSQDQAKVSADQTALTMAQQQLAAAQSTATLDHDHDQSAVTSDQTRLQGDQSTLASLQSTAVSPGSTYTWLPKAGEVINEDQPVYSLSNEPVPLLYGSIPSYRAFYPGMSDGADVGELTRDLIALGYGDGLTQGNHYSSATAAAVERWQQASGLPATGQILLGEVVFEPGPIQVTAVTPSVGQSASGAGGSSPGGGSGGAGGGTVLTATSTTPQVSLALDAGDQSEVAVGDKVTITLPDNETTPGVISSVGAVAGTASSNGGTSGSSPGGSSGSAGSTITVLVSPTDPAATKDWDAASVNVTITTSTITSALVVPVDALLAQPGGGYAVEVAGASGARHLVTVSLGLFDDADGLVQITGTSLTAGQKVVVPNL